MQEIHEECLWLISLEQTILILNEDYNYRKSKIFMEDYNKIKFLFFFLTN